MNNSVIGIIIIVSPGKQLHIWRHFQIQLPEQWEMLLHGKDEKAGRCAFADRYQHRLELNWSVVPGPPDFTRMLDDYVAEFRRDDQVTEVSKVTPGPWSGFTARLGDVLTSRFGRYFPRERCLLELVFLWPERRDIALERRVLDSVREESLTPDKYWRWRAFGMDCLASAGFPLQQCTIQPGLARLVFGAENHRLRTETFERLGMVAQWLHRPLREWLALRRPSGVVVRREEQAQERGMEVYHLVGDQIAQGWGRLRLQRIAYESLAWINPDDGRLFCQTISGAISPVSRRLFGWEEC